MVFADSSELNATSKRVVFFALCGIVGVAATALCLLFQRERPDSVTPQEVAAAFEAARDFYETVREHSSVDLPPAKDFGWSGETHRTSSGRPYIHVSAGLGSLVSDGANGCDCVSVNYDLSSREVITFRLWPRWPPLVSPPVTLDPDAAQRLTEQAKEFALQHGGVEYEFDYANVEAKGHKLAVDFDRVIDGVHYTNDFMEVVMSRSGFVCGYNKRREWAVREIVGALPAEKLRARSRALASAGRRRRDAQVDGQLREIESFYAAGSPRAAYRSPPRLRGYRKPRALFASSWMTKVANEDGSGVVKLVVVFVDAHSGALVLRKVSVYSLKEDLASAKGAL